MADPTQQEPTEAEQRLEEAREAEEVWEEAQAAGDNLDGMEVHELDEPSTSEEEFADAFEEFAAGDDGETENEGEGPPQEAAHEDEEGEAAPQEGAAEQPDIWADATPEQRAAFEAAQHENSSNRERVQAQNRKISDLLSQPGAAQPAAPVSKPATTEEGDPVANEEWEKFEEEYPEVAGPISKRYGNELAELKAENAKLRGEVSGINHIQRQEAIDTEEAVLLDRHPDWKAETSTPEFSEWLPNQPRYVQDGFQRNGDTISDGDEAASLMDLFKADMAPPAGQAPAEPRKEPTGKAKRRAARLTSAVSTESGQAGPGAGPPEGDFDSAFEHYAAQP